MLIRLKLSKEGYQCEEANNAEQTLNMLVTNLITLVMSDIKMPCKSGAS
jgi:CheY-like chemotaxis protein